MKYSRSEENYLKAIFHLQQAGSRGVSTNDIAEAMETKASSVTDMIKKLAAKDLVNYVKYQGVSLTESGRSTAIMVIRKHRLWEVFLVNKLDFPWDKVHDIAEQLEHIKSEELVTKLEAFLDYPSVDPHGDPIPDQHGNFKQTQKRLLVKCDLNEKYLCVGVKDSSSEFLRFLDKKHINIGSNITVLSKEEFDDSMQIQVDDQKHFISKKIAENIYVSAQ
ncbi:metal-dependent transcriptional regulator [Gilvibacter sp.]|uniref:metal-dependent transcriptional regulator n=1 Tax=Gilvibacter sp. TaxID=2729997 RepID=UPI0025BA81E0|nr:metal-dependent transcriptional regulator [Gilvibacter sp.]NQX76213.1 metal-dependent transcriptional regulator [Gilvibacter sp.]